MDLRQHRHTAVAESVDQVELPQRAGSIERPRRDSGNLLAQLLAGSGTREGQLANVKVQIEVNVIHPVCRAFSRARN